MVNYQNGKIYKIVSNTDDDICYVGSTTKKYLSERMDSHRSAYRLWKDGRGAYLTAFKLFEKYEIQNCRIELLELVPCNSKDELCKKEGQYIKALNCVNKVITGRTSQEYYQENKVILYEKQKIYTEKYKEYISERQKAYREKNKEQISERQKINSKKYNEKRKIKYTCCCGSNIQKCNKIQHEKTEKHIDFMKSQSI